MDPSDHHTILALLDVFHQLLRWGNLDSLFASKRFAAVMIQHLRTVLDTNEGLQIAPDTEAVLAKLLSTAVALFSIVVTSTQSSHRLRLISQIAA